MRRLISRKSSNVLFISLTVAVLLAFLWQYIETGTPPSLVIDKRADTSADYYLLMSESREYNQQGELVSVVNSPAISHQPATNSTRMRSPALQFYEQSTPTWAVNADWGEVFNNGSRIELEQQVVVASADQSQVLKTPALTIFPNRQFAKTEQPVTLLSSNGFTRAIGLRADLKSQQLELLQQVRGQYEITP